MPSTPYDVKGLLLAAIEDEDPVIFMEHKLLFNDVGEVPDEYYTIRFGEAAMVREGTDCTVVALGRMVGFAAKAIDKLAAEGITCDLIDLRTTSPLDEETILESVQNTGRLVVVDEAPPRCGIAADIAGLVSYKAFRSLKAPIVPVTAPHSPIPFSPDLERLYIPGPDRIEAAIREILA